jgi:hypothetical protein
MSASALRSNPGWIATGGGENRSWHWPEITRYPSKPYVEVSTKAGQLHFTVIARPGSGTLSAALAAAPAGAALGGCQVVDPEFVTVAAAQRRQDDSSASCSGEREY